MNPQEITSINSQVTVRDDDRSACGISDEQESLMREDSIPLQNE
jgi:hypothetical protein